MNPSEVLAPRIIDAVVAAFGDEYRDVDPLIRPSRFADVQCNAPMSLAKRVGMAPRDAAAKIVEHLDLDGIAAQVEISGPGFLNITMDDAWLAEQATQVRDDERLGVPLQETQNIPIDYSAPNAAKEMHVGHLRTTVVGDALTRLLRFLGHHVIPQNHIGDWGTPYGMLIEHLLEVGEGSDEANLLLTDPNEFYRQARAKFEGPQSTPEFAERARRRVTLMQGGDPETLKHWNYILDLSKKYFNRIYRKLDVLLTDDDLAGESMYNQWLPGICEELEERGIAEVSDGALCVFLDGYTGREGKPVPLIIRKSDGGYGYGTTDLATIRYRAHDLDAHRALYVIGAPQALHLNMVWDTARKAGWMNHCTPTHVQIGNVLGADGKILRTRAGDLMTLEFLVDQAIAKARATIAEMRPDLDEETRNDIGWQIGTGALKYADLSVAHDSEYTFDLDRMLALTGNTGPYLQYAAARTASILRKAQEQGVEAAAYEHGAIRITEAQEHALVLALLDFPSVVEGVGESFDLHKLCGYLFDLAQSFTSFYENCPVLKADDEATRVSRLALTALTGRVLVLGLSLLGIRAPEEM